MVKKKLPSKSNAGIAKRGTLIPRAIVGIGASAGGLEAVTELLENLSEKTGMAFVYVQHLDPTHKSLLTPILSRVSRIPVEEAKQGVHVLADHLYIIPPNKNMLIKGGSLQLATRIGGEGRLVSIDNFFRSLAADQKNRSIGVILSGNASDGILGLEAIKGEGGITFAQEEKSAKHPSMPHSAIASGAADHVLAPADIAGELVKISHHPHITNVKELTPESVAFFGKEREESLQKIFAMLQAKSGVNFFQYKSPTLKRRISRRMVLHKIETLEEYVVYLKNTPAEVGMLFQDMLINVTEFFRDREVFENLKRHVFPALLKEHSKDEPLRLWSAGCSTGEEAYSLAMCLIEYLDSVKRGIPIQIFGSDLNEACIAKARTGIYPLSIAKNVSSERLRRFFTKVNGNYQISKAVRDMCVFAKQDLLNDPPFSQLDLIACRNVLIYFEPVGQKRVLPIFHYALKSTGYLVLGKSEGIGEFTDLYLPKYKTHKIYAKKASTLGRHLKTFLAMDSGVVPHHPHTEIQARTGRAKGYTQSTSVPLLLEGELSKDVDRILLSQGLVAPSVVIDEDMQIVQFRGHLAPYLNFPTGKATWNLLKMAHEGILMELRGAITDAKKKQRTVLQKGIVNIEVIPLKRHTKGEQNFLIVLRPGEQAALSEAGTPNGAWQGDGKHATRQIEKLEREILILKEHLRTALEEEEGAREEFQSVNEEIVSSNEELQSTNEELETAKEELQSTNEELVTVNEELQTRNTELSQTNNDLSNILNSSNVPIIIVDRELRIRRLTSAAEKSLHIIPSDIGRSITDIKLPIRFPDLRKLLLDVIENVQPQHQEIEDEERRFHTLWVRPYKTWDNKIDGAVMTLIDIDDVKKGKRELEQSLSYAQGILGTMREPLLVLDKHLRIKSANAAFYRMFGTVAKDTEGIFLYELKNHRWDTAQLREVLEKILPKKASFQDLEITFKFPDSASKVMLFNGQRLLQSEGSEELILLAMQDITEQRGLQQRNDSFMSMASHELKTPVTTIKALVQILQKRFEESEDKMLVEYLIRMDQQIEQLTRLVTDLLDVSKIKAEKFVLEEKIFDFDLLATEIVKSCQLLSPRHVIVIKGKTQAKIKGDRSSISRVFINLLVNAIKYSPNENKIIVTLSCTETEVCVGVQDFGIGIEQALQGKIFERFFQIGNDNGQNFSGLGIGLYISEAIVAQHRGRIWVESKEGNGATFFFTLPMQQAKGKKRT